MKLTVPEILKTILIDNWEAVTRNNQVRFSSLPHAREDSPYLYLTLCKSRRGRARDICHVLSY